MKNKKKVFNLFDLKKMKKKLLSCKGESLVETLLALLIACMALLILPGAILTASRVNSKAEKAFIFMDVGKSETKDLSTGEDAFSMVVLDGTGGKASIETKNKEDVYKKNKKIKYYYYQFQDTDNHN